MPIDGLTYQADFISSAEAEDILSQVDAAPWMTSLKRRVQHYGYRYDYKRRTIDSDMYLGQLPTWLQTLANRLHAEDWIGTVPDQVIVNEYLPGQGIAPHVDCEPCFGDTILSLTLGAGCVMNFAHVASGKKYPIWLAIGSLVRMQGVARYAWTHGIASRKSDLWHGQRIARGRRVSLTFRQVILQ